MGIGTERRRVGLRHGRGSNVLSQVPKVTLRGGSLDGTRRSAREAGLRPRSGAVRAASASAGRAGFSRARTSRYRGRPSRSAQGGQGDGPHGEAGRRQVGAKRGQRAGAVVHDERRAPHGVADPHGQVEPSRAQYQAEVKGGGAPIAKAKSPPGRSARYTRSNSAGRSAGRKCPSAPKLTARSKPPAKGSARASARTHAAPGCARRACASMPALKSTPVTGPRHSGSEDAHARAGAAAHVQSPAERPEPAQRAGGRVENALGGAERRVVELRGQQVVAALDRRQRLDASSRRDGPRGENTGQGYFPDASHAGADVTVPGKRRHRARNIVDAMWAKWVFIASLGAVTSLMRAPVGAIAGVPGGQRPGWSSRR